MKDKELREGFKKVLAALGTSVSHDGYRERFDNVYPTSVSKLAQRQEDRLRRLEEKLNALAQHLNLEIYEKFTPERFDVVASPKKARS